MVADEALVVVCAMTGQHVLCSKPAPCLHSVLLKEWDNKDDERGE